MLKHQQPRDVFERVKERDRKAEAHLAGRTGFSRFWAKMHLRAGDLADEVSSITGDEHVAAGTGLIVGLARGLVFGLFAGGLAFVFPGIVTLPAGLLFGQEIALGMAEFGVSAVAMIGTSLFCGLQESIGYFRNARANGGSQRGAEIGDKIAQKGGALAKDVSPVTTQALKQMREEGVSPKPSEPPHPDPPENKRFADAVLNRRTQMSQEAIR